MPNDLAFINPGTPPYAMSPVVVAVGVASEGGGGQPGSVTITGEEPFVLYDQAVSIGSFVLAEPPAPVCAVSAVGATALSIAITSFSHQMTFRLQVRNAGTSADVGDVMDVSGLTRDQVRVAAYELNPESGYQVRLRANNGIEGRWSAWSATVTTGPEAFTPLQHWHADGLPGGTPISAFSANGGSVQVNCTEPHGLSAGDGINICYGSPSTWNHGNYRGKSTVQSIVSATAFTINRAWTSNDAGGWSYLRWGLIVDAVGLGTGGRTFITNENAFAGVGNSFRCNLKYNEDGYGNWGFGKDSIGRLYKGRELWIRLRVFIPDGFGFDSSGATASSGWIKFVRLGDYFPNGAGDGFNDILIRDIGDGSHRIRLSSERKNDSRDFTRPGAFPRNQWLTFEYYLKLDNVPLNRGGGGVQRLWIDGQFIGEADNVETIPHPDGYLERVLIWTYWNGSGPRDQYCYVDDVVIATDASPPTHVDPNGRRYIGMSAAIGG